MHTEAEARTKVCPMARARAAQMIHKGADVTADANDRVEFVAEDVRCVGKDCMAWRWTEGRAWFKIMETRRTDGSTYQTLSPEVSDELRARLEYVPEQRAGGGFLTAHYLEPREDFEARCKGYCGMAGAL